MPAAAGSDRSARPPSQSPFSSRTARAASISSSHHRLGLGSDVAAPARPGCAVAISRDRRVSRSGYDTSDGSDAIWAMTANGTVGGSSSTSVAGRIPAIGSAAAVIPPQLWPTTWSRRDVETGSAGSTPRRPPRCRGSGGARSSGRSARVPGRSDRDHVPAGRRQRRPDPPPDGGRRRDAVDQDEGPSRRVAPASSDANGMPAAWRRRTACPDRRRRPARLDDGGDGEAGRSGMRGRYHARTVPQTARHTVKHGRAVRR